MEQLKGITRKISVEKEPRSYDLNPSEPVFTARYLGNTNVVELFKPTNGYTLSCKYADQLLKESKNGRKASKVELLISTNISRGVSMTDPTGKLPEQNFQLQNIAFCTIIKQHPKVFTFIAEQAGKLECHAFLCSKNEKSRAICVAVTKAFTVAHSEWSRKRVRVISKKERNAVIADIVVNKPERDVGDQDSELDGHDVQSPEGDRSTSSSWLCTSDGDDYDDYGEEDSSDSTMLLREESSSSNN